MSRDSEGFRRLPAVGGHTTKPGAQESLLVKDQFLWKPLTKHKEYHFYQSLYSATDGSKHYKNLMPKYYGVDFIGEKRFLKLENLVFGLKKPYIMDIKVGTRSYGEDASKEKIAREKSKFPLQEDIGVRLVGIHTPSSKRSKAWCLDHTRGTLREAFLEFFLHSAELMNKVILKLLQIKQVFEYFPCLRFYGSSLLFTFDGEGPVESVDVKMIDFAHVFKINDKGRDIGYITGLQFIIDSLKSFKKRKRVDIARIGGHVGSIVEEEETLVKVEGSANSVTMSNEIMFYQEVQKHNDIILGIIPRLLAIEKDEKSLRKLILEDLRVSLCSGKEVKTDISLMDIKLGTRTHALNCPNIHQPKYFHKYKNLCSALSRKEIEEIWKFRSNGKPSCLKDFKLGKLDYLTFRDACSTSRTLSCRLTGFSKPLSGIVCSQKESCFIRKEEDLLEKVKVFLGRNSTKLYQDVIFKLEKMLDTLERSNLFGEYEFVGTSLLVLYSPVTGKCDVKLIDFGRATKTKSVDGNGILKGIKSLKNLCETIAKKSK